VRSGVLVGELPRTGRLGLVVLPARLLLGVSELGIGQRCGGERLGRSRAGNRDVAPLGLEVPVSLTAGHPHGLRQLTGSGARGPRHAPGPSQEARQGGLGDQEEAAREQERREDLRPQPLKERGRGPVQALAENAAVNRVERLVEVAVPRRVRRPEADGLGRKRQQERREQQNHPGVHRCRRLNDRAQDERDAPSGDRDRHQVRHPPRCVRERARKRVADRAAVPAHVEHAPQVHGDRDHAEADQIQMALLEPGDELARARTVGPPRLSRLLTRPRTGPLGPAPGGAALAHEQHV
jgi:hypothetical protein